MRLITLGPAGTFSHEAALSLYPGADIEFVNNFDALFDAIVKANGKLIGLVPVENSLHGSVDEILDLLRETDVRLWKMQDVAIHHAFGAQDPKKVTTIASHPQALKQCRQWIRTHYLHARQLATESTALAVDMAKDDPTIGAIALKKTIESRGLPVIENGVEGNDNTTRFGVVGLQDPFPDLKRTQMSIMFHPREDYPGLLHKLLTPFKIYDVNMTRIENRPVGSGLGNYYFYVDFIGSHDDERTKKVLDELKEFADVKVLGEW